MTDKNSSAMEKLMSKILGDGAEYADIRAQRINEKSYIMKNRELDRALECFEDGVGFRILKNGSWSFGSYCGMEPKPELVSKHLPGGEVKLADAEPARGEVSWKAKKEWDEDEAYSMMRDMDEHMRVGKAERSLRVELSTWNLDTYFLSSEGSDIHQSIPYSTISIKCVARENGAVQSYSQRFGNVGGVEIFDEKELMEEAERCSKTANLLLSARAPPSGRMKVICDQDLAGVMAHEAVGHAAEGDLVANGESILEGKIGKKVANELVTIVDDPNRKGMGSFVYDDEGVRGREKKLIENGVLCQYIVDRAYGYKLGFEPNGGARAESYGDVPLVRMSNTFIAPGKWSLDELLENMGNGIYLMGSRGGEVDTTHGSFQFNAKMGHLVKNGEIGEMIRDVSLQGSILQTLNDLIALGKDLRLHPGFCGKGQTVPVGTGAPHILLKNGVVGGL